MKTTKQVISFLIEKSSENRDFIKQKLSILDERQLNWKPGEGIWSVVECIGHSIVSHKLYHEKLNKTIKNTEPGKNNDYPYKHSFAGKLLIKAVDPGTIKKVKTFQVFKPVSSNIDKSIFNEFEEVQKRICELADKMRNLNLKKIKISSPISKLIRMNIGDPLVMLPLHDRRHLNQAFRLTEFFGFPN